LLLRNLVDLMLGNCSNSVISWELLLVGTLLPLPRVLLVKSRSVDVMLNIGCICLRCHVNSLGLAIKLSIHSVLCMWHLTVAEVQVAMEFLHFTAVGVKH
jgi:hypothetical protein